MVDHAPLSRAAPRCRYAGVIFDLDGTLADTEPLVIGCMLETISAAGLPVTEQRLLEFIGPPLPLMLHQMYEISEDDAQRIYRDYLRRYAGDYLPRTRPLPGAGELLDALRDAGVPLALVTNKREDAGRKSIEVLGWTERFIAIVGANTAAAAKPDPAPIRHALGFLGADPSEAAIVGDTESDMGAARNAGLAAAIGLVGVRTAEFLRERGATAAAESLDEVRDLLIIAGGAPAP